jgi:hypothetical protein
VEVIRDLCPDALKQVEWVAGVSASSGQ